MIKAIIKAAARAIIRAIAKVEVCDIVEVLFPLVGRALVSLSVSPEKKFYKKVWRAKD